MLGNRTEATFVDSARIINGKPQPAGTLYVLARGGLAVFAVVAVLAIAALTAFLHPIIGALLALSVLFVRGPKLFTGWHGACPACHADLYIPGTKDSGSQGFDCYLCKNRLILRNGAFEIAPTSNK